MGISFGGPNWIGPIWRSELVDVNRLSDCLVFQSSLCTCLSRIKVEHLGSIKFSNILKLVLDKSEFTSFWSIFARLRVIGPS